MTNNIKNICVFASSSNNLDKSYYEAAQELGALMGKSGYNIVYGGSRRGLMYTCAAAVKGNGGKVYGVMPEIFVNLGFTNPEDCDEFYLTAGMRERKAKMDELSEAVIAIAGGFGTLEEVSEMIVQKQLGYNNKPIVILNTNNFYHHLLQFFEDTIRQNFANNDSAKLYHIAASADEAIEYIATYSFSSTHSKFIN